MHMKTFTYHMYKHMISGIYGPLYYEQSVLPVEASATSHKLAGQPGSGAPTASKSESSWFKAILTASRAKSFDPRRRAFPIGKGYLLGLW